MNLPLKISYLHKETRLAVCNNKNNIKVLTYRDGKDYIIYNNGKDLMLVAAVPNVIKNDTTITPNHSFDEIKQLLKERRTRKEEEYIFLRFQEDIIDFCFEDSNQGAYVLTIDGHLSFVPIRKLVNRFVNSNVENPEQDDPSVDIFEDLLLNKEKWEENYKITSTAVPSKDFILPCGQQSGAISVNSTSSYLYIIFMEKGNLKIFITDITLSDGVPQVKESITHELFQNVSFGDESLTRLFVLSCRDNFQNVAINQVLYEQLFDSNTKLLNSATIISLPNGSIFHVMFCSPQEKLKLICNLKQPLVYLCNLSITEVKSVNVMDTIYQLHAKSEIEKSIKSFKETNTNNNCLLFFGKQGKLIFLFPQKYSMCSNQVTSEYQLSLPIATCASLKDMLFVSDFNVINVYKVFLVAKVTKEFNNCKKTLNNLKFIPEPVLIFAIPVPEIINLKILDITPLVICCINNKRKVMRIECEDSSSDDKKFVCTDDIDGLIRKLECTHLKLNDVKIESRNMNSILYKLKNVALICHIISKQNISCKNQPSVDILFRYQRVHHNSQYKLLIVGKLLNNTALPFIGDWSISVTYYQKYCKSVSIDTDMKTKARTECFNVSILKPNCCFEFSFFLHPSFAHYSEINIDNYVNFSFKSIFKKDRKCKPKWNGVSLYFKTCTLNIIDMCHVIHNISEPIHKVSETPHTRIEFVEHCLKHKDLNYLVKQESLCLAFLISPSRTKHLQKICKIFFDLPYACNSIANLVFKFLLKEKDNIKTSDCSLTLLHLNGDKIELNVEEATGIDIPNAFMLKVTTRTIGLLTAVHLYIFSKFKDLNLQGKEYKELFKSKLLTLQELKRHCEEMDDKVYNYDDDRFTQEDVIAKLYNIYLELRKTIW